MSNIPPPLSAQSSDRMVDALDRADRLVDTGVQPNEALAKAAAEFSVPVSHVPLMVRSFNTGRSVQQLQSSTDPWVKAAEHPMADADGIIAILGKSPAPKQAVDVSDYVFAPDEAPITPPARLSDSEAAKLAAELPVEQPVVTKQAFVDNRISLEFKAAAIVDKLAVTLQHLPSSKYLAVKEAAIRTQSGATEVFEWLESNYEDIGWKAAHAVGKDVTVTTEHPAVKLAVELVGVREQYYVPTLDVPEGYTKLADDNGTVWYEKKAVCPILGVTLPEILPAAVAEGVPQTGLCFCEPDLSKVISKEAAEGDSKGGFLSGLGQGFTGAHNALATSRVWGKPMDALKVNTTPNAAKDLGQSVDKDMSRLDEQGAIQDMLMDPRFAGSDPRVVLSSYQQLRSLAPNAMANPAVASDYVQRRLQTGPLSYFDLSKLVEIEHNLAKIKQVNSDMAGPDE